jgi:acetolactate synthase-1/2/3 large subunit
VTGLDLLCSELARLDVRHVFGLPGTQNSPFYSALPRHGIRPVLATHELSAAFMANGYARSTGRVGVVATIPGPGFAFALAGLAEARLDSVPLLHLVGTPARGPRRFLHQAIDQAGIAAPLVKRVVEVGAADEVVAGLREAHALALEGEPGPVILHLTPEAMRGEVAPGVAPGATPPTVSRRVDTGPDTSEWAAPLRALVLAAERPVIFAGAGTFACADELRALAERWIAPTFTTLTARGVLPEDHPNAMWFDADRGSLAELNALTAQADLILALGCKFSHNGTAGFRIELPEDRLVHVNTDPEALGSTYPARLEILGRVEDVIAALRADDCASRSRWTSAELAAAKERISALARLRVPEPRFAGVPGGTPEAFYRELRSALPRDGILMNDSGLHQVMTRRHFQVLRPRGLITPADFQSMGFGVPAAIGAAIADPARPVVALVGDGGFLMAAMDLGCAAREKVPLTVVVFNDGHLNLIRVQQLRDEGVGSAVDIDTPDLQALAAALSVDYRLVDGDVASVIRGAIANRRPTLVEVRLGDSVAIHTARSVGLTANAARRVLGPGVLGRVKGLVKAITRR